MFSLVLIAVGVLGCFGLSNGQTGEPNTLYVAHPPSPYNLELELYNHVHSTYEHHCEATVISTKAALTSAACTHGTSPFRIRFRHGNTETGHGGNLHQAERIFSHPNYQSGSNDFNIAVILVKDPFPNSAVINMAKESPRAGQEALSTGWGLLPNTNTRPKLVRHATFPIFDHEACRNQKPITDRIVCAGHLGENLDCAGDLGAPLVSNQNLVGVVLTRLCGSDNNNMGLFSNVANLQHWIQSVLPQKPSMHS